jgi:hypothetical protein
VELGIVNPPLIYGGDGNGNGVSVELDAAILSPDTLADLAASARRNKRVGLVCIKNSGAIRQEVMKSLAEIMGERVVFCF